MRIGFDAKRAYFNQTGLGNYSRFIIQGCIQQYPDDDYFLFSPEAPKKKQLISLPSSACVRAVELGKGVAGSFTRVFRLDPYFRQYSLDIYHGLSNELPLGLSKVQTKLVVSVHDLLFMRYPAFYPWVDRAIYRAKTILSCKRADLVIAISEQTKRDLVQFLGIPEEKIKVHYQTCHPQFRQAISSEQIQSVKQKYGLFSPYILQVGTLESRKNALTTLKAYDNSKVKRNLDLVFVGNKTPYCESLYSFVKEKGLGEKVRFIHQSDFVDFPSLYAGSLFTVYPSLFEGFGIPVLESLTMQVPVITSKGGCFSEVGGEAALYIDPQSSEELTYQMEQLADSSDLRAMCIEKNKIQAAKFTEDRLIQELHEIYRTLLH